MPKPRLNPERPLTPAEKQAAYRQRQAQVRLSELQQKGLPAVPSVPTIPAAPRWNALLTSALTSVRTVQEEMQVYFDDRSEVWQEGVRGQEFSERLEAIEQVLDFLSELQEGR